MFDDPEYQWDKAKAERNFAKHGVAFDLVYNFDWDNALNYEDSRNEYGERRSTCIGAIYGRLYVLIWTLRQESVRVISLRKANDRERKQYYDEKIIH